MAALVGLSRKQIDAWTLRLVAAAVVALWSTQLPSLTREGMKQDFLNLYTGAQLAREGQWARLHEPALQLEHEKRIMPERQVLVPFVRPHAYALLLMPLAALPHGTAFWFWFGGQILAAGATLWWATRRFGEPALLWGLMFPGLALGTLLGQDPAVLLATAAAGWHLAEKGKPRAAGFVWGLGLVKFHLLLGLGAALLMGRKWRMAQGFAAAGALLVAVALALGGTAGLAGHFRLLTNPELEGLAPSPELMTNLQALAANLGLRSWAFYVAMGAAALVFLWMAQRGGELWRWYASAMACGLWLAPHVYGYDGSILLPALWLGLFESGQKWTKVAAGLYAAPVALFFNLAGPPWAMANSLALLGYLAALGLTARRREN